MNYNIKLNLSKLSSFVAAIKGKTTTKKCLCIPLDSNGIYVGEKGIYLELTAVELHTQNFGQSHFIRVSLPKEAYQQLSEDEKKNIAIVGNMKVMERPAAVNPLVETAAEAAVENTEDGFGIDDLPF